MTTDLELTYSDLASEFGVQHTTIRAWVNDLDLPYRRRIKDQKRVFLPDDVNKLKVWRDRIVTVAA